MNPLYTNLNEMECLLAGARILLIELYREANLGLAWDLKS
ncbi:hypothetical protein NHE_0031 [Neorickettsia helminthoeca str. Oregon]|uniref:Uncharacterized protein n=1 Tax=Neorickettsia helminthoeca str. Oregon TaxID=1286528 RepID=X5H399_9RICK|nr:hypothetical protein NHE_0031 [Neorickettsia helminthoeca str. Oregon]